MMRRLMVLAAALFLVACTEKPQELDAKKIGGPAWEGTDNGYAAPGWQPGDAKRWEEQINNRTRQGQNEYERTGGAS